MSEVNYSLNGVDFTTYGVYVSASAGLLSRPKLKKPTIIEWTDYHGDSVDLTQKYYESRGITLTCFIAASGKNDFVSKANTFLQLFDAPGTQRIMVDVGLKPLIYEVYLLDGVDIAKVWNESQMTGTFTLKLNEPSPVKKVLKFDGTANSSKTCTIVLSTDKAVDFYWGDGTKTVDIYGTPKTIVNGYDTIGVFYIVITGCIDEITSITLDSNTTEVWSKL